MNREALEEIARAIRPWDSKLDCCARLEDIRAACSTEEWRQIVESPEYQEVIGKLIGLNQ